MSEPTRALRISWLGIIQRKSCGEGNNNLKFKEMIKGDNVCNETVSQGQESGENIQFSDDDDDDGAPSSMKHCVTI